MNIKSIVHGVFSGIAFAVSFLLGLVSTLAVLVLVLCALPFWFIGFLAQPKRYKFVKVSRFSDCDDMLSWVFLRLCSVQNSRIARVRILGMEIEEYD